MSFSSIEAIKTVNEYKQKVGSRLIYVNDPISLDTANQGLQFIEGILAKTTGSDIKFQDYNEMIKYMNSIDYLGKVIAMPNIDASKGKCTKYINKLRKDKALEEKNHEFGYYTKLIWTLDSFKADYSSWLNKEKQINIPDNYLIQAEKIISKYMKMVSSLPIEKQKETKSFLYNLKFAESLFKTDRELNDKIILTLIQKLENKTKRYGPNIFFSIIDVDNDEYRAISKMQFWLSRPINNMFTINDQMVGQGLNQILSGELAKQKDKQAKEKSASEAEAKKEKEEKEKKAATEKETAGQVDIDDVGSELEGAIDAVENASRIQLEMPNLGTQPGVEAQADYINILENAENSVGNANGSVNNFINQHY